MALELKFYKTDNTPWGFRLTGGADCDFPLTVVKVTEDSIAEEAGLQVEDVIVRINEEPTSGLTHMEAHDVIARAGNCFIMTIRKDYYASENFHDDEICDIMEGHLENGNCSDSDINTLSTQDLTNPEENILKTPNSDVIDAKIAEAISGETEVLPDQNVLGVNFNKIDLSQSTVCKALADESTQAKIDIANKKWSTFLQTPERPIVVPKSKDNIPKALPYKPIIKRQSKIDIEIPSAVVEPPIQVESEPYESNEEENAEDIVDVGEEIDPDSLNEDENSTGECNGEDNYEEDDDQLENVEEEEEEEEQEEEEEKEEVKVSLTLEEQLAMVEKQLKVLASLPSEVQVGLEAVTKQLAQIVRAQKDVDEEENSQGGESQIEVSQQVMYDENDESAMTSDDENEYSGADGNSRRERCSSSQSSECEYDENSAVKSHISVIDNSAEIEEEQEVEVDLEAQQFEEEKLIHQERKNVQLEESHQRRLEQRPTLGLAPIQRPIILPGGRRWSQPDDAVQVPKKGKMTDEKISETLNTYAEVISGRTKG